MMSENLNDMVNALNNKTGETTTLPIVEKIEEVKEERQEKSDVESKEENKNLINITNFHDWFLANSNNITGVSRVRVEVSNINSADSFMFKVPKGKTSELEEKELISFYNPKARPILNLPQIYLKVFKNDTFVVLHQYNEEAFIKSYGVKTGLIIVFCKNVNGMVLPLQKIKIKKGVENIELPELPEVKDLETKLKENVDVEALQLLYKQSIKFKDEFTTKEKTLEWFLKKQNEIIDINHLIKIDSVLISVI